MIKTGRIYEDVKNLIEEEKTNDPEIILEQRDVVLLPALKNTKVLGMYKIIDGVRFVIYNPDMDYITRRMVFAHELGHDFYHQSLAENQDFVEYTLFDIRTEMETEANIFAAHLILDEDEIMNLIREGATYNQLASIFNVNVNMMIFKLNEMQRMGYKLNFDQNPDSNFFRNM